ncbi:MAG TPA: NAD(P)/FAD-dependent oxidoreductase, partial [Candidatus Bathyarchaeota archaeon]|nr:NAD(P)/FAD-dependent oxidoreductase [Candidatus Bathyarchaeota archaeon]
MARRIVIIGANAAGISAAAFARKTDRTAEIVLIEKDRYAAYSRCGLPFAIAGEIPSLEKLVLYPPSYYKTMRLDLRLETEAKRVDLESR